MFLKGGSRLGKNKKKCSNCGHSQCKCKQAQKVVQRVEVNVNGKRKS